MRHFWSDAANNSGGYHYRALLAFRVPAAGTPDERMLETACSYSGPLADAEAAKLQLPGVTASMKRPANPDDFYPPNARSRGEQGSPVLQACVGPSGQLLREPVITDSSGNSELDDAAIRLAKAMRYAAGEKAGIPVAESCIKFKVKFGAH